MRGKPKRGPAGSLVSVKTAGCYCKRSWGGGVNAGKNKSKKTQGEKKSIRAALSLEMN